MALIRAKCDSCGANLEIEDSRGRAYCQYCGTPYIFDEANKAQQSSNNNSYEIQDGNIECCNKEINDQKLATKFVKSEIQARHELLCLLIQNENAPIDVVCRTQITKIDKEYYPIAIYDITCNAKWNATSIWEHEESYQEEYEEIVYVDYKGKDHMFRGKDVEEINGYKIEHYRQPQPRKRYVTKTRLVPDGCQYTDGKVDSTTVSGLVWLGENEYGDSLIHWIERFDKSQFVVSSEDYLKDYKVISNVKSNEDIWNEAERKAEKDMEYLASSNVPGNRFEGLTVSTNFSKQVASIFYLGVYHIYFNYKDKKYDCIITGGNTGDVLIYDQPIDDNIKNHADSLQMEANDHRTSGAMYVLGAVFTPIITASITITIAVLLSIWFSWNNLIIVLVVLLIVLLVATWLTAYFVYKHKIVSLKSKYYTNRKESFLVGNNAIRRKIIELINSNTVPEDNKCNMIEKMLNEYNENTGDNRIIGIESNGQEIEMIKKKVRKGALLTSTIILAVVGTCLVMIIGPSIIHPSFVDKDSKYINEESTASSRINDEVDSNIISDKNLSPWKSVGDDVYLQGKELLDYFSTREFEQEFGETAKSVVDKKLVERGDGYTLKEYVDVLTNMELFLKYKNKLESIDCRTKEEEEYIQIIKGFYYIVCDHAASKYVEIAESSSFYRYMMHSEGITTADDLGILKRELYDQISNPSGNLSDLHWIADFQRYTIVGANDL